MDVSPRQPLTCAHPVIPALKVWRRLYRSNSLRNLFTKCGRSRAGPDDAHIALQCVEELWQLVQVCRAQENADRCSTRIVDASPLRVILFAGAHSHGAKPQHPEGVTVESDSFLHEENWPAACQLDCKSRQQKERSAEQQNEGRKSYIEDALLNEVGIAFRECGMEVEHVNSAQIDQAITYPNRFAEIHHQSDGYA